MVKGKRSDYFL